MTSLPKKVFFGIEKHFHDKRFYSHILQKYLEIHFLKYILLGLKTNAYLFFK